MNCVLLLPFRFATDVCQAPLRNRDGPQHRLLLQEACEMGKICCLAVDEARPVSIFVHLATDVHTSLPIC